MTTPALRTKAASNIEKALVNLSINHPFFASIVMKRRIDIEDKTETAYVTLAGRIAMGTEFTAKMTPLQTVFVLAHEAMHYAMEHGLRRENRDPGAWNEAADYVINDILLESNVGQRPENGLFRDGARNFSAEQLYRPPQDGGGGGGEGNPGTGQGQGPYQPGKGHHDLSDTEMPEGVSKEELRQKIAQEIQSAVTAAKKKGDMPAGLARMVDKIINPPIPWVPLLMRFMTGLIKDEPTWSKPRKKMLAHKLHMPSPGDRPALTHVGVVADSSGSISRELPYFLGGISSILEECRPEKITLLHVDAEVHKVDELTMEDLPLNVGKLLGGGGTDMPTGIRWFAEEGVEPDVVVVFTDGYSGWEMEAVSYPVVVVCTTDAECGDFETIRFTMED